MEYDLDWLFESDLKEVLKTIKTKSALRTEAVSMIKIKELQYLESISKSLNLLTRK